MFQRCRGCGGRSLASALGIALALGLLITPSATGAPLDECPEIMTVAELRTRIEGASSGAPVVGTGYTVARGTQPEPFDVEFLGVLDDGILPGRDMIVVEANSPAIAQAGGIWAGMSGSPVYLDGKLVGAVAFSLSFGPSRVGGLTPAEDMMPVLERSSSGAAVPSAAPERVRLSDRMVRRIAAATGVAPASVGESLVRLRIPLSVTGLNARGLRALRHFLRTHDVAAIPFNGSSVATSDVAPGAILEPGGNFAAALSYGDVTFAGIGTTTMVCNGRALAFGHPFFWQGDTVMGANVARAITVVDDPLFGPYKLANVGDIVGTVDQDRLAGIRARLDQQPSTMPVHSTVTSLDSGRTNESTTNVVWDEDVTHIALEHLFFAILVTHDENSEGSSTMSWSIDGVTESGARWRLDRTNMYTSRYSIPYYTIDEFHWQMHRIDENRFEPVTFTGIDADIQVQGTIKQYAIKDVRVSVGGGRYRKVKGIKVRPGQRVSLRVTLGVFEGTATQVRNLTVRVPRGARRDGTIVVTGGRPCTYRCPGRGKVESFAQLIAVEERQPRNNELFAYLTIGSGRGGVTAKDKATMDMVVTRQRTIELHLARRSPRESAKAG
jgi:hypothetical protein